MSICRFKEVMAEMWKLNQEAMEIVEKLGDASVAARASLYWHAHVKGAIDRERSDLPGASMLDMSDTLKELESSTED